MVNGMSIEILHGLKIDKMEPFGIKTTIYDFFSYFIPGVICNNCIIFAIYFSGYNFSIPFKKIFGEETLSLLPNWFLILTLIFVTYIFGIIISNISSLLIEKGLIGKIPCLNKYLSFDNILSDNTYRLFHKKIEDDLNITFSKNDIRLIITNVENKAIYSYNTAFVFLTIYGTNRNLCCIFLVVGLISLIVNIIHHCSVAFPIILIILSATSLYGYIRFYRYYISHLISAYLNTKN
jgi:hypothetical protein